ncbi:hypothetical protein O181_084561 [Austropuccinia psidii MF-1]|uniref:Retrovirus-related Pol polyprotein from transposon TNT 1-94-like beta-barrel domain-containing protein n=1 Tax=Austropuccinia psidii MF-1 TaxID=1389203 RepID=A0A9Q3FR85_9BASI|nr:hypothetical protein [Austropuccinia psidii MF-1]
MRNLWDMLIEAPSTIKTNPNHLKKKEMVYYFIVGHLADENYNKYVSEEDEEPYKLWNTIKENYVSSSGENIASHFRRLFSIKFPPSFSGFTKAFSSFRATLKLLQGHFSYFSLNKSLSKITTIEELFKEVEIEILRRSGTEEQASPALQVHPNPKRELCHKGKHNPLSNYSECQYIQLFPEKREAYCHRKNDKNQQETSPSLSVFNNINNVLNKTVLDSGCSNTIAPTSNLFSHITPSSQILLAANGSDMEVTLEGTLHLNTTTGRISITNSLIFPFTSSLLVSPGLFPNKGATLKGSKGGTNLFDQQGNLILSTKIVNNILLIHTASSNVAF